MRADQGNSSHHHHHHQQQQQQQQQHCDIIGVTEQTGNDRGPSRSGVLSALVTE